MSKGNSHARPGQTVGLRVGQKAGLITDTTIIKSGQQNITAHPHCTHRLVNSTFPNPPQRLSSLANKAGAHQ
jgi:hypothetical protein